MRIARRRTTLAAAVAVLAASALLAGCAGSGTGARPSRMAEQGPVSTVLGRPGGHGESGGRVGRSAPEPMSTPAPAPVPAQLPGLGPKTRAKIPANARQVVLVTGKGKDSSTSSVTLYRKDPDTGWTPAGPAWPAHNALHGWTSHHYAGDLRSPIGVFTLTDGGGQLADPGTKLTYDQEPVGFSVGGTGFEGEPLAGSFDYVIAINYNRRTGVSPRDWTRPMGRSRGGGIWLHVDHGGPTHGCVSLPKSVMKTLLRTLTPDRHPVVVMGDAAALAR
jgi:L,D-peptidoglycan transpeptidase YkuD (ErfK/YbiS/YcfS/YnhG family)